MVEGEGVLQQLVVGEVEEEGEGAHQEEVAGVVYC